MRELDNLRHDVTGKILLPVEWSPLQEVDLASVPTDGRTHPSSLFMEDTGSIEADFEQWQAEMKEKNAERAAEDAEEDAVVAVTLAAYCLDVAEWAVVHAELARGEANQLAGKR